MNSTQIGITAAVVLVVAAVSATALNSFSKSTDSQYSEKYERLNRPIPRRFPIDEYIYDLNPSYKSTYDADIRYDIPRVSDELDFDRPGYNADRKARDPTMPLYDPFRNTLYKPFVGGTRCVNCHSSLRYTRRK